jgi:hypothetical protein
MAHDAVIVAELHTLPADVLAAKTYDVLTVLRGFVDTRVYLNEVITSEADGGPALANVGLLQRARAVAKERRAERTAALAKLRPLIRDLRLSAVVDLVEAQDDDMRRDLERLIREATTEPSEPPERDPACPRTRRPRTRSPRQTTPPERSPDGPFAPMSPGEVEEAIAAAQRAMEDTAAFDRAVTAVQDAGREALEALERTIPDLLDDGGAADRAIQKQDERLDPLVERLGGLREQAADVAASVAAHIGGGLVVPCAEHDHFVTGRGLEQALYRTLETFPSRGEETRFIWGFAAALLRGVPKYPAPVPPDLGERLTSFVRPLPSCQGRWARSAVGALSGPSPRVAALCLAAEAAETDKALAADLRHLAVTE